MSTFIPKSMEVSSIRVVSKLWHNALWNVWASHCAAVFRNNPVQYSQRIPQHIPIATDNQAATKQQKITYKATRTLRHIAQALRRSNKGEFVSFTGSKQVELPAEIHFGQGAEVPQLLRKIFGVPALPSNGKSGSRYSFTRFFQYFPRVHRKNQQLELAIRWKEVDIFEAKHLPLETPVRRTAGDCEAKTQISIPAKKDSDEAAVVEVHTNRGVAHTVHNRGALMTSDPPKPVSDPSIDSSRIQHRPLVVGLTKRPSQTANMASTDEAAALNREIEKNIRANTKAAAPAEETPAESSQTKQKKEKAPKQPKPQKAAPAPAPTSPALIDLRVGHILRAIAHPNADSLYVSTIAMGDPEGTEHTQIDEETGKVVRTVCSGLNGLVPLAEMQDRKIIVVANLKPVNMRSIKSAAMVLAASPKQEEGADPHAPDRVVELVVPPEGSEAGDKVYFEGWPYGEGKGPEKQLNPKKKQWEAIQPGFYTSDDLVVGFDASKCEEVSGSEKGNLVVEGKGHCTVKTLKGAVVR